jgi:hypothetical protein
MIPDVFDKKPDLLKNLARHGALGALARLHESSQNGVHALRPNGLPSEQALFTRLYQNDYGRISAREMHNPALRIHAGAAVPAFSDFVSASAGAAKMVAFIPVRQSFGVSEKRSVISRKQRRNGSKIPKPPHMAKSAGGFLI